MYYAVKKWSKKDTFRHAVLSLKKLFITVADFVFSQHQRIALKRGGLIINGMKGKTRKRAYSELHALISVLSLYAPVSDKAAYTGGSDRYGLPEHSLFRRNRIKAFVVSSRKSNSFLLVPPYNCAIIFNTFALSLAARDRQRIIFDYVK